LHCGEDCITNLFFNFENENMQWYNFFCSITFIKSVTCTEIWGINLGLFKVFFKQSISYCWKISYATFLDYIKSMWIICLICKILFKLTGNGPYSSKKSLTNNPQCDKSYWTKKIVSLHVFISLIAPDIFL
jgi:hypothetical protein